MELEQVEVKTETVIEPQVEAPAPKKQELSLIEMDSRGLLKPKNHVEFMRDIDARFKGGFFPASFKSTQEVFAALLFVRSLGLPDNAVRQVAVIHGVPSIYGDLPLSLTQSSGKLKKIREYFIDSEYNEISVKNKNLHLEVWAAVCEVQREGDDQTHEFYYTRDEALHAGQLKDLSKIAGEEASKYKLKPWHKYTKLMLKYKARSQALKTQFADAINGVAIAEYDFDIMPQGMKDVSPNGSEKNNAAAELNGI